MPTTDDKKNKGKTGQGKDRRPKGERQRGLIALAMEAKTVLAFYVLVVVAIEIMLTTALVKVHKEHELAVVYGMLFVMVLAGAAVAFFAYKKPSVLLGATSNRPHDDAVQSFATEISGYWWQWISPESITPESPSALSFVRIEEDPLTGALMMTGQAYDDKGELATEWKSAATFINVSDKKVFYYWKGGLARRAWMYEGFGEFSFLGSLDSGRGFFSDAKLTEAQQNTIITKQFNFRRAASDDATEVYSGDKARVSKRVSEWEKKRAHLG